MFKTFAILLLNLTLVSSHLRELKRVRQCPASCPACTQCDTTKGTCSIPLNFNQCNLNNINGVCVSGMCKTNINLPKDPLQKCQTYQCPTSGTCSIINLNDGTDCTFPGNPLHSYCLTSGCNVVLEGLTITLPQYNTGCLGLPNEINCDTNHNLLDGETCQENVCKFPDGTYNGILPPQ